MNFPSVEYFHELTPEQFICLAEAGATWKDIADNYKQPDWCTYPYALEGDMGCWSLTVRPTKIKSKADCATCDLCRP